MTSNVNSPAPNYLDFLPKILRNWGEKIYEVSKADKSMICYSLLGALSSCGCHLANEKRYIKPDGTFITGPIGISLIVIAGSGSLKSTVKNMAFKPIEEAIALKIPEYTRALGRYKKLARKKLSSAELDEFEEPQEPVTPNFLQNNVTIESVIHLYGKGMHSMTLLSDEGGTFVGSRAMSKDSYISTLSSFNTLLSGDVFSKSTIKSGETLLAARRLTFMMYMQPQIFDEFLKKCGNISDAGFMQRTLIANASAAQSDVTEDFVTDMMDSFYNDELKPQSAYASYEYIEYCNLISALLDKPKETNVHGLLTPKIIEPSPQAKTYWLKFYVKQKRIIKELAAYSEDAEMSSFRERAPETVSRIATLFQLAENYGHTVQQITIENMANAISIVELALEEQFRVFDIQDEFFLNVDRLTKWYEGRAERKLLTRMPLRRLIQCAPKTLRKKETLVPVLEYLIKEGVIENDQFDYIYNGVKSETDKEVKK